MDGFAIARDALDSAEEVTLPVVQRIAAGSVGTRLAPGSAARIFTGGPIPPGAEPSYRRRTAAPWTGP